VKERAWRISEAERRRGGKTGENGKDTYTLQHYDVRSSIEMETEGRNAGGKRERERKVGRK